MFSAARVPKKWVFHFSATFFTVLHFLIDVEPVVTQMTAETHQVRVTSSDLNQIWSVRTNVTKVPHTKLYESVFTSS
jgi:hypothetical protein